jgi:hypothetical protein
MLALPGPAPHPSHASKTRRRQFHPRDSPAVALGVAAWMKFSLDSAWWAAVGVGLLVFVVTPFIVSRVWAKYLLKRMERAASETDRKTDRRLDRKR